MAKAKVIHSSDACTIIFKGNPKSPEPTTGVISFPGGQVEVSRCSDGTYWAHIHIDQESKVVSSRIDYDYTARDEAIEKANRLIATGGDPLNIPQVPVQECITQIAARVDGVYKEPGE